MTAGGEGGREGAGEDLETSHECSHARSIFAQRLTDGRTERRMRGVGWDGAAGGKGGGRCFASPTEFIDSTELNANMKRPREDTDGAGTDATRPLARSTKPWAGTGRGGAGLGGRFPCRPPLLPRGGRGPPRLVDFSYLTHSDSRPLPLFPVSFRHQSPTLPPQFCRRRGVRRRQPLCGRRRHSHNFCRKLASGK